MTAHPDSATAVLLASSSCSEVASRLGLSLFGAAEDVPAGTRIIVVQYTTEGARAQPASLRKVAVDAWLLAWVTSDADKPAERAFADGFDDVATGVEELQRRLTVQRELLAERHRSATLVEERAALAAFVNDIAQHSDLQDLMRVVIARLGEHFPVSQTAVVLAKPGDEVAFAVVERPGGRLDNLAARVADVPELGTVLETGQPTRVLSHTVEEHLCGVHAVGAHHRSNASQAQKQARAQPSAFGPAVLLPLERKGELLGALYLRAHVDGVQEPESFIETGRLIAAATSVAIGHALAHDILLGTHRTLVRRQEHIDERLSSLKTFSDIFEKSFDGILITADDGTIRYANPAAGAMLQRRSELLKGTSFFGMLTARSQALSRRAFRGDPIGDAYGYVDLLAPDEFGAESVISAAIRPLGEGAGVLISFRDVTELREIETELRQTRDFLENLIQSSVDAIVAADVDGRVILFNRAAEQILGFSAREVLGHMHIDAIYPPGEARDVMRRLRSEAHGGRGRLESVRKDLVAKSGDRVPVQLTAAVIYEEQREAATVGIFTDLRERVKMEAKLSMIEHKLRVTERQAGAFELAGTAAHELNQPLTSIMGYGEMLKQRISETDPASKAVHVICREAERMAAIVKKLGQITFYETKPYVGDSQILELGDGVEPAPSSGAEDVKGGSQR